MFQAILLSLVLSSGILVGPYRVADAQPGHHEVRLQAGMAADGHFAVVWLDSLQLSDHFELDLYIRFFDKDGNPMTDPYKIKKVKDASIVRGPALEMDTLGNTILLWDDYREEPPDYPSDVRFQRFGPDGNPADTAKTLSSVPGINFWAGKYIGLSNRGEFAVVTSVASEFVPLGTGIWVQRFNLEGIPLDTPFLAHEDLGDTRPLPDTVVTVYPSAALNDAGDLVVTWIRGHVTNHNQPRYQVFDSLDSPISWEPLGHRVDDGVEKAGACRPDPCWIDNDRFVAFWTDYCIPPYANPTPLLGRVFSQKGAVKHPLRILAIDTTFCNASDPKGRLYTAVLPDGRFAETHRRQYGHSPLTWGHAGGILGQVVNNEPWRRTTLFEYSAPFGSDTLFEIWDFFPHYDSPPAVAACNDWLVWVYSRLNTDTIFEAWAVITDWDMGVGASEKPPSARTDFEVANPIGREIVVRFWDSPQGFHASVYDASGRKVDELTSSNQAGILLWGEGQNPGVYFIVSNTGDAKASKVILIK